MLIENIKDDLYRYHGKLSFKLFLKYYFLVPNFNYIVWFRILKKFHNPIFKYIFSKKCVKFGIFIPAHTDIGAGFKIEHIGNIVINGQSKIGKNCNVLQGVTIGSAGRGENKGYVTIGDNCYIGPGAKIIGNVLIGDNVLIGANAVVTKNIEDNAVVVGIPGKVISCRGSMGYINNKIEERK